MGFIRRPGHDAPIREEAPTLSEAKERREAAQLEHALSPADERLDRSIALLESAVEKALKGTDFDLNTIPDEELLQVDVAQKQRLAYIVSLLDVLDFLRRPLAKTKDGKVPFSHREARAKVALNYIKHLESTQLEALQLGRHRSDEALQAKVDELRKRLAGLAKGTDVVEAEVVDG